jgi:hypothetical protein
MSTATFTWDDFFTSHLSHDVLELVDTDSDTTGPQTR